MADPEENKTLKTKTPSERKVEACLRTEFGLQSHKFNVFNAVLPQGTSVKDLGDYRLWSHVAGDLTMFDEIRAVDADGGWVADLIVIYKFGTQVRCQVKLITELEDIDYGTAINISKYQVKQRGMKKWCILEGATVLEENIPTQELALKRRHELLAALAN
jgi:hypothetical protein